MKEDFSELIGYLNGKFGKIDERFNNLFEVFATKEDLKEAVKNLSTKEDFNNLMISIDTCC